MKFNHPIWTLLVGIFCALSTSSCTDGTNGNGNGDGNGGVTVRELEISRFTTADLSSARSDSILVDGTNVLQTDDGAGDVACQEELIRTGEVTVFTVGDGNINSSGDFNAVIGEPGYVKLVNQINWCNVIQPNVIGCAPIGGSSMVVVRIQQDLEGILWDHEYGHTKGLGHRDDPNAVMNPTISPSRRRVNSSECQSFLQ